jgi:hypothetical protein
MPGRRSTRPAGLPGALGCAGLRGSALLGRGSECWWAGEGRGTEWAERGQRGGEEVGHED